MIALPLVLLVAQSAGPAASPAPAAPSARPVVALETSLGTIKIALDRDKAPASVENPYPERLSVSPKSLKPTTTRVPETAIDVSL